MANNTIYALKRKLITLKTEKENASDKVGQLEQKLCQQKDFYDKVNTTDEFCVRDRIIPWNYFTSTSSPTKAAIIYAIEIQSNWNLMK